MSARHWCLAAGMLFFASSLFAGEAPKGPTPDDLLKYLAGGAEAPKRTAEEVQALCKSAVDALVAKIAAGDVAEGDRRLEQLANRAGTPGKEEYRLAVAKALVAKLGDDVPKPARTWVVRHLERIGRAEAVAPLATLLADAELREPVRRALMANPDPAAGDALRAALASAPAGDNAWRVALLDALGARAEAASFKPLAAQAGDADDDVRTHAAQALARLANAEAGPVIAAAMAKGSERAKALATDAYLALADNLAAKGEKDAALAIYKPLLAAKSYVKCAALIGIGKAGTPADVDLLVGALAGNAAECGAAAQGLILLSDPKATPAIAEKSKAAEPKAKAILISVLGDRGDPAIIQTVLDAAKDADEGVRAAACEALGKLKSPAAIAVLVAAIKTGKDAERDKAEWALARIPGKQGTDAIVAALPDAAKDAKVSLLRSLGYRNDPGVLPTLLEAAKDKDEDIADAAFRSVAQLNDPKACAPLLDALKTAQGKARDAALYALRRTTGKEANAALVEAAKGASPAVLAPVLEILSWRDDPATKALLLESVKNADPAVQAAALDGLGRVKDPAAVPVIIEAATKGQGPVRDAAILAALWYTDDVIKADKAAAAEIYTLALDPKVVKRHEDRQIALRALGPAGTFETLDKLRGEFLNDQTQGDAHGAAFRIAERIEKDGNKDSAIAAYTKIMGFSRDRGQLERAQRALGKLGIKENLPRKAGFITYWWILGPYPNPDNKLFSMKLNPEGNDVNVDLPASGLDGEKVKWVAFHTTDPAGIVNLDVAVAKDDHAAALLYTEVTVPKDTDALLKLGYQDGVVAYLNGKKVHDRAGARFRIDDQRVPVKLVAGPNKLLLKVVSTNPGWSLCARLSTKDHQPLEFTEREK